MPRYFFHLYADLVACDEEGQEAPDVAAAREIAIVNIRDLAKDQIDEGRLSLGHRIEVADESGEVVARVTFADAIAVEA